MVTKIFCFCVLSCLNVSVILEASSPFICKKDKEFFHFFSYIYIFNKYFTKWFFCWYILASPEAFVNWRLLNFKLLYWLQSYANYYSLFIGSLKYNNTLFSWLTLVYSFCNTGLINFNRQSFQLRMLNTEQ